MLLNSRAVLVESLESRRHFSTTAVEASVVGEDGLIHHRTPQPALALPGGGSSGGTVTIKKIVHSTDPDDPGVGDGGVGNTGPHTNIPHPIKPGKFFDAVMVGVSNDPVKVAPKLKELGIRGVRLWGTISWDHKYEPDVFERARKFNDLGFSVNMLLTTNKMPPSAAKATEYFAWTLKQPFMKNAVDRWEIINEPNLKKYWEGSLKQYVDLALKPAWNVYHPAGETVIGGGISEDINAFKSLVGNGYLKYCDVANLHPYGYKLKDQVDDIDAAKKLVGTKPLTMTEWNFHGAGPTSWSKMLNDVRPLVVKTMESAYYYRFMMSNSYAGPAGLVSSSYVANNPFYSTFKGWKTDNSDLT
jgi:hypothetical protein